MKINNYSGSLRIFRARKYFGSFPHIVETMVRIALQESVVVVQMRAKEKYMWNMDADKLDVHDMDEGRTYIIRLINPKIEFKHQFLQIT